MQMMQILVEKCSQLQLRFLESLLLICNYCAMFFGKVFA
jgi:hypothetical protein